MRDLELENSRLRKHMADLASDELIFQEALEGTTKYLDTSVLRRVIEGQVPCF